MGIYAPSGSVRKRSTLLTLTLAVVIAAESSLRAQAPCEYELIVLQGGPDDCGLLPPSSTFGRGISERGQVAGGYTVCGLGPGEAFQWNGAVVTLSRPADVSSAGAWDINDAGLIIGQMSVNDIGTRAFLHDGTGFIDLGTLPGGTFSRGRAINSAGQIVGIWGNNVVGNPGLGVFLWQDGVMTNVHADLGVSNSEPSDINDKGQITGWMGEGLVNGAEAFIWQAGAATTLGHLPDGSFSVGESINEVGQVAGWTLIGPFPGMTARSFFWNDGKMTDLGLLEGFDRAHARAINDVGQIVGTASGASGNPEIRAAFIWQHGVMTDLNDSIPPDSGVTLLVARAINNAGQITGWCETSEGRLVTFLLTPIDQPPGDVDHDCTVGKHDLNLLLAAWGDCPATGHCFGDVDEDGDVDVIDLLILLGNWSY